MELATQLLNRALDVLGQANPGRVMVGILIGLFGYAGSGSLHQIIPHHSLVIFAAGLGPVGWASLGVLLALIPLLFTRDASLRERDREVGALIEKLIRDGELTQVDRKTTYRALLVKVVEAYRPSNRVGPDVTADAPSDPHQEVPG